MTEISNVTITYNGMEFGTRGVTCNELERRWNRANWESDWDFGMFEQLYAERMGWA